MPPLCKGRWVRFIALGGIVKVPQTSSLRYFWRFSFFAQSRYHRTSSFARKRNSEPFSTVYSVSKTLFRHAETTPIFRCGLQKMYCLIVAQKHRRGELCSPAAIREDNIFPYDVNPSVAHKVRQLYCVDAPFCLRCRHFPRLTGESPYK